MCDIGGKGVRIEEMGLDCEGGEGSLKVEGRESEVIGKLRVGVTEKKDSEGKGKRRGKGKEIQRK